MINKDVEKLLLKVQKPGRYVGSLSAVFQREAVLTFSGAKVR